MAITLTPDATAQFSAFLDGFDVACDELEGRDVVLVALKRHFKDVCCAGDQLMQIVLAALRDGSASPELFHALHVEWEEDLIFAVLDHIVNIMEHWYELGYCKPDVWWAS